MTTVILYAVDIGDLEGWVGRGDPRALQAARQALVEDYREEMAEAGEPPDPEQIALMERLLERLMLEGKRYEGLDADGRYDLTQLLIDLFDQYAEPEALSDEIPLPAFEEALAPLRRSGTDAGRLAAYLLRGRELCGNEVLWPEEPKVDDVVPYFGFLRHEELAAFTAQLEAPRAARGRPQPGPLAGAPPGSPAPRAAAVLKTLRSACRNCLETEHDLLAFVSATS